MQWWIRLDLWVEIRRIFWCPWRSPLLSVWNAWWLILLASLIAKSSLFVLFRLLLAICIDWWSSATFVVRQWRVVGWLHLLKPGLVIFPERWRSQSWWWQSRRMRMLLSGRGRREWPIMELSLLSVSCLIIRRSLSIHSIVRILWVLHLLAHRRREGALSTTSVRPLGLFLYASFVICIFSILSHFAAAS